MKLSHILVATLLCISLITACSPISVHYPIWKPSDVRYIDNIDSESEQSEIIAVSTKRLPYNQPNNQNFFRIDFLELHHPPQFDIFILMKFNSQGNPKLYGFAQTIIPWNFYIQIQAKSNKIFVINQEYKIVQRFPVSIFHQNNQDSIEIAFSSLNPEIIIPTSYIFQILLISPDKRHILDSTPAILSTALSPPPINVLFAFWNTFPAYTPVQTLRRWDGAHTGPYGGRHGLYNLLRTANSLNIPIVLLDIRNLFSFAALDYAGQLDWINSLEISKTIIMPSMKSPLEMSVYPYDSLSFANDFWEVNHNSPIFMIQPEFHIGQTKDYPLALSALCRTNQLIFSLVDTTDPVTHVESLAGCRMMRIPKGAANTMFQPGDDGLPNELKKAMIQSLYNDLQNHTNSIILLGGNLPLSSWGDPQIARESFRELKSLPWIKVLDMRSLISLRGSQTVLSSDHPIYNLPTGKQNIPLPPLINPNLNLAQATFFANLNSLIYPSDAKLPELRSIYYKIIPAFSYIDQWNTSPTQSTICPLDITSDNNPDCFLANEKISLWIDPRFGTILFVFVRSETELHEVIAPAFQLANGYSDSTLWDLSQGIYAEKVPYFYTSKDELPYNNYKLQDNAIILSSSQSNSVKTITLNGTNLNITYKTPIPNDVQYISLVLDPWLRFKPGWGDEYFVRTAGEMVCWSLKGKVSICIKQDERIKLYTFKDTKNHFTSTEDPNIGNPLGHYLPFPMAVFEINNGFSQPLSLNLMIFLDNLVVNDDSNH